jgi:ABC-type nitrate/sulfonate/bicarbonate transport system substrate-binding protein
LKCDVVVPLVLNLHGNAITLSTEMSPSAIQNGEGLKAYLAHYWKKSRPFTLAAPHRHASHHILLHGWLRRHGLDPNEDAEIVFLPPQLMPRHLKAGHNSASILSGTGWCPATSADLSYGHPEKVLLVAGRFLREEPDLTISLVTALLEACRLCQDPAFQEDLIAILSRPEYTGASPELLRNSLCGHFETGRDVVDESPFHLFHGETVNRPTVEKASWLLAGLRSIGALPEITAGSISRIHREDLFHAAAARA